MSPGQHAGRRPGHAGFSAVELSICLAITALLIPIVYRYASGQEDATSLALWHLRTADQVETVAEELHLDARRGAWQPGGLTFIGDACPGTYRLTDDHVLVREAAPACDGTRALASGVSSVTGLDAGLEITFVRLLRPDVAHTTTVFIPVVSQ